MEDTNCWLAPLTREGGAKGSTGSVTMRDNYRLDSDRQFSPPASRRNSVWPPAGHANLGIVGIIFSLLMTRDSPRQAQSISDIFCCCFSKFKLQGIKTMDFISNKRLVLSSCSTSRAQEETLLQTKQQSGGKSVTCAPSSSAAAHVFPLALCCSTENENLQSQIIHTHIYI